MRRKVKTWPAIRKNRGKYWANGMKFLTRRGNLKLVKIRYLSENSSINIESPKSCLDRGKFGNYWHNSAQLADIYGIFLSEIVKKSQVCIQFAILYWLPENSLNILNIFEDCLNILGKFSRFRDIGGSLLKFWEYSVKQSENSGKSLETSKFAYNLPFDDCTTENLWKINGNFLNIRRKLYTFLEIAGN